MIKDSIFVKITILFMVAIICLGAFSYYFIREEINEDILKDQLKYSQFLATINQLVRFGGDIELIEKYLKELDLHQIQDAKTLEQFQNHLTQNLTDGMIAKLSSKKMAFIFFCKLHKNGNSMVVYIPINSLIII